MKHRLIVPIGAVVVLTGACGGGDASQNVPVRDALRTDQSPEFDDQQPPSTSFASEQPSGNEQQPPENDQQPALDDPVLTCESLCERFAAQCGESTDCTENCVGFDEIREQCPAETDALLVCFDGLQIGCQTTEAEIDSELESCEDDLRALAECAAGVELGDIPIFGDSQGPREGFGDDGPPDVPSDFSQGDEGSTTDPFAPDAGF